MGSSPRTPKTYRTPKGELQTQNAAGAKWGPSVAIGEQPLHGRDLGPGLPDVLIFQENKIYENSTNF